MSSNNITILSEKFTSENNDKPIDGLTVMIDGQIKEMFDIIISREETCTSYTEVLKNLIFIGVESYINKYNK